MASAEGTRPGWWLAQVAGAAALLLLYASVIALDWHGNGHPWFLDGSGRARPHDFAAFFAAGRMAASGDLAAAYDPERFVPTLEELTGPLGEHWLGWLNPPPLALLLSPLTNLPYEAAFWAWILVGLVPLLLAARLACPWPGALIVVLAAPASLAALLKGQNGFLTAGLLGLGITLIARSPTAAGASIGMLVIKPHIAALLPFVLLAGRRVRAFAAAGTTVVILTLGSAAMFGAEGWTAFRDSLGDTTARFLGAEAPRLAMTSLYAATARLMPEAWAMAFHAASVSVIAFSCVRMWAQPNVPVQLRGAATIAGSLLVSPYIYVHDLVALGLAVVLLQSARGVTAVTAKQATMLMLALLLPGATLVSGDGRPGLLGVVVVLSVAFSCARRAPQAPGNAL